MHRMSSFRPCLILTDESVTSERAALQISGRGKVAPEVGFEPTTNRLTADRSTTELLRSVVGKDTNRDLGRFKRKL
jgi:hypothetical protein